MQKLYPFGEILLFAKEQRFNESFKRMWEYYLSYCEAGFLLGSTDVHQILFNKFN